MKLDISKVVLSRNDIKRNIHIPDNLSEDLAEDVGFHIGDGYMKERTTSSSHNYNFVYCGHSIEDKNYFENILLPRKKRLFNVSMLYRRYSNKDAKTIEATYNSKGILTFYRDVIGVGASPKNNISIPRWIFISKKFMRAFLRGFIDSDGCLTFLKKHKKKHYYPIIRFEMKSKNLFNGLDDILKNLDFKHASYKYEPYDKRNNKFCKKYYIDINGKANLEKWIKLIGFNDIKHLSKLLLWKKFGFYPNHLSFSERTKILNGPGEN